MATSPGRRGPTLCGTGRPAILKTRRLGYDGKGQATIRAGDDPVSAWRAIGEARLWMRPLSEPFIAAYVARHWDSIRWTVGCYEIEGAGVQLFDRVEGDPWTIIGMPMLPLLAWLRATGMAPA